MSFSDSRVVRDIVKAGAQTAVAIPQKLTVTQDAQLIAVYVTLGTAPTGATTFKVDVNKNGTTVFTDQATRPIFVAGAFTASALADSTPTDLVAAPSGANFSTGYYENQGLESHTAQSTVSIDSVGMFTADAYVPLATFAKGDLVSVDVDAVGNTIAGSDLVVTLVFDQK